MARINTAKRVMTVKIVYYGPGLSGKTTNLLHLHQAYPQAERGDLVKLDTETERTLFFDYFPANLGSIGGFRLKADFFTVPGQSFYNATRKVVLEGADGLVFVADSHPNREDANVVTLQNMKDNLAAFGRNIDDLPLVFQWNKQDIKGALTPELLRRLLNPGGAPAFSANALDGTGVWETQDAILKLVLADIKAKAARGRVART